MVKLLIEQKTGPERSADVKETSVSIRLRNTRD